MSLTLMSIGSTIWNILTWPFLLLGGWPGILIVIGILLLVGMILEAIWCH